MTIKVLVVDDSALIRAVLGEIIRQQPDMELVGAAADPYIARDLISKTNPDVLTLDIEMPRMDGLEFLERLMHGHPMPVLMLSSLTEAGADVTLRALELGAVDFFTKPKLGLREGLNEYAEVIADKIRTVASAKVQRRLRKPETRSTRPPVQFVSTERVLLIGASTGGTEAIKAVLERLPANCPGVLVTQHMPAGFTRSFAERLNRVTGLKVCEAQGNERLLPGHVFIAPGDKHLKLTRSGANYITQLSDDAPVNRHRPAVDVLFHSAALAAGKNAVAALLTGMGKDGADGLLAMRNAGAHTIAQDEASSVVYGMPREAVERNAACEQLPLPDIAAAMIRAAGGSTTRI
ncbi:chemotaxis response regulator protein-glutamate methylesterase [Permianibacter sp. IMCC34836]|uniref:protein-glutamate methylesterase/protein-glutamine glutaminase n=1 Tax=Permianibacter fluminis TaxID=2738515 RepID=UPI001556AA42|nr:chemotaxis response regulator protein-glutamate methylesterase [Permianibacter fluminis]NQD36594.1 chemotaxis response regulator protein-glutamate methylesterase [Permianibacter fluminis]